MTSDTFGNRSYARQGGLARRAVPCSPSLATGATLCRPLKRAGCAVVGVPIESGRGRRVRRTIFLNEGMIFESFPVGPLACKCTIVGGRPGPDGHSLSRTIAGPEGPGSLRTRGINGWVETHPYQPRFIWRDLRQSGMNPRPTSQALIQDERQKQVPRLR